MYRQWKRCHLSLPLPYFLDFNAPDETHRRYLDYQNFTDIMRKGPAYCSVEFSLRYSLYLGQEIVVCHMDLTNRSSTTILDEQLIVYDFHVVA